MVCIGEIPGWFYKDCPDTGIIMIVWLFLNIILPILLLYLIFKIFIYFKKKK